MSDLQDEKDKNLSHEIDEEENLDPSPSDSLEEELDEQPDEDQQEDPDDQEEEQPTPPSRRENLRIQQLISKMRQQGPTPEPKKQATGIDYRQTLDAEDTVYEQLETDRKTYGEQQYAQGAELAKANLFHTRLEIDAPKVAAKYKQLDSESAEFNPTLANALNEWYLQQTGFDPATGTVKNADLRYMEYIEAIFELGEEIASRKAEKTRKNIAKQAANTGLRPDGSSAKRLNLNKAPADMTDEELDMVISQAVPKR